MATGEAIYHKYKSFSADESTPVEVRTVDELNEITLTGIETLDSFCFNNATTGSMEKCIEYFGFAKLSEKP